MAGSYSPLLGQVYLEPNASFKKAAMALVLLGALIPEFPYPRFTKTRPKRYPTADAPSYNIVSLCNPFKIMEWHHPKFETRQSMRV